MPIANLWVLSEVVLPGGTISQIVDQDYSAGLEEMIQSGSGSIDPEYIAIGEAKPMLSFSSTALATALGIAGLNAAAISASTSFYFKKRDFGGVNASGSAHLKMTLTKGMICPKSVEASHGLPARISYVVYPVSSDGSTAPVTITTGQALPTASLVSELFTVGPVGINGTSAAAPLASIKELRWDLGMDVAHEGSDGHAYPTYAGLQNRRPRCEINGLDMTALSTHGLNGLTLTSFVTYFRKIASGGYRVADATTQHIKMSGTGGMLLPRGARGSDQKPLMGEWNIVPKWDGTNDVVAISTSSAIA